MTFKRQALVNGKWVDGDSLEWRNVDICDGCHEIMTEGEPDFTFHADLWNDSTLRDSPRLTVHQSRVCYMVAIQDRAAEAASRLEWPV